MGVYETWTYKKPTGRLSRLLDFVLWKIGYYHVAKCDRPGCNGQIILRNWEKVNLGISCSRYCAKLMLR